MLRFEEDISEMWSKDNQTTQPATGPAAFSPHSWRGGVVSYEGSTFCLPVGFMSMLAYVSLIWGALFLAIFETKSSYVLFHAWQSIIINVVFLPALIAAAACDLTFWFLWGWFCVFPSVAGFFALVLFVCMIFAISRAPNGKLFKLPLVGQMAKRLTDRTFPQ